MEKKLQTDYKNNNDENKDINKSNKDQAYNQDNLITLTFKGFSKDDIIINEAKEYRIKCNNNKKFFLFASGIKKMYFTDIDILINGLSIKKFYYAQRYIKENSLFLSYDTIFLPKKLTIKKYLQLISLMYCNFDLSNATLSSFSMNDLSNIMIKNLTKEQKQMLILSLVVACPNVIWFIDNRLLSGLTKEKMSLFKNAVKIRLKQGGVVIYLDENE